MGASSANGSGRRRLISGSDDMPLAIYSRGQLGSQFDVHAGHALVEMKLVGKLDMGSHEFEMVSWGHVMHGAQEHAATRLHRVFEGQGDGAHARAQGGRDSVGPRMAIR